MLMPPFLTPILCFPSIFPRPGSPPKVWHTKDVRPSQRPEAFLAQPATPPAARVSVPHGTAAASSPTSLILSQARHCSRTTTTPPDARHKGTRHITISKILGIHTGFCIHADEKNFVQSDYTCWLIRIPKRRFWNPYHNK